MASNTSSPSRTTRSQSGPSTRLRASSRHPTDPLDPSSTNITNMLEHDLLATNKAAVLSSPSVVESSMAATAAASHANTISTDNGSSSPLVATVESPTFAAASSRDMGLFSNRGGKGNGRTLPSRRARGISSSSDTKGAEAASDILHNSKMSTDEVARIKIEESVLFQQDQSSTAHNTQTQRDRYQQPPTSVPLKVESLTTNSHTRPDDIPNLLTAKYPNGKIVHVRIVPQMYLSSKTHLPNLTSYPPSSLLERNPQGGSQLPNTTQSSTTPNRGKNKSPRNRSRSGSRGADSMNTTIADGIAPQSVMSHTINESNAISSTSQPSNVLSSLDASATTIMGEDGNMYNCHICNDVGDVVCCDNCPYVYHPECMPKDSASRNSLEADDDPWFCPACIDGNNRATTTSKKSNSSKVLQENGTKISSVPADNGNKHSPMIDRRSKRDRSKRICVECNKSNSQPIGTCDGCGAPMHIPSCKTGDSTDLSTLLEDDTRQSYATGFTCTNCKIDNLESMEEEEEDFEREERELQKLKQEEEEQQIRAMRNRVLWKESSELHLTTSLTETNDESESSVSITPSPKRQRVISPKPSKPKLRNKSERAAAIAATTSITSNATATATKPSQLTSETSKNKRKPETKLKEYQKPKRIREDRKQDNQDDDENKKDELSLQLSQENTDIHSMSNTSPVKRNLSTTTDQTSIKSVKLTPAFFYYLWENRIKLERHLGRKNRSYKRSLKGHDRNLSLAREGAIRWQNMSKSERRRYIDMSVKEFEDNILLWKEDEALRAMIAAQEEEENDSIENKNDDTMMGKPKDDILVQSDNFWDYRYQSHSSSSKVSCPSRNDSTKQSNNKVLLELLQDVRYHPLPICHPNRAFTSLFTKDMSKVAVPYFLVEGPYATSLGDECVGCSRGWNHFCHVLKAQIPAVEFRAKLQSPCSSLMATRIGLGLDFSKNVNEVSDEENLKQSKHSTLDLGSASMLFPTNRNDDITSFIEKATDIKLSNIAYEMEGISPQIQSPKFMTKKKTMNISEDSETHDEDNNKAAFKCGICKSTTLSNLGCVTCRRTQLMNNMSSKSPETLSEVMSNPINSKRKLHKVHTDMLPRYPISKLNTFNRLTDGDKIFANVLVSHPWTPTAILPHRKKEFPKPKSIASQDEDSESDSSSYSDDDDGSTSDSVPSQLSRRNSIESLSVEASRSHTSENGPSNGKDSINAPRRFTRNSYNRTNSDFSDMSNTNRQAMAVEHKEEAAELSRRCLHTAICCILFGLLRRDPLRLFFDPVSDDVEDYHQIITSPIDFRTIRDKVVKGQYQSLGSFVTDVTQLCHNALCYNPPGSVYYDTAIDLKEALKSMQKRASDWMYAIKNAHSSYFSNLCTSKTLTKDYDNGDPFQDLRSSWPGAVEMLDDLEWYKSQVSTDFIRTKENENAYYSTLAVKRAARAADALLCKMTQNEPYIEPISFRDHDDDENLRKYINEEVSKVSGPLQLHRHSTSREIQLLDLLKKIRKRRVDRVTTSHSGCARCDGLRNEVEARISRSREAARKFSDPKDSRIAESRLSLSTGLASKRLRESQSEHYEDSFSIRGSKIQGWGLFSERIFKKGEVVAEYVGEYVTNANADAREQLYEESRIQDYQFRVSNDLVIDATKFGGFARYINHSCDPNCISKVIKGDPPNERMKRVVIISQRDIQVAEEITYDYQFPLELDPESRIICNCSSKNCRGFMNWDSQETTTNLSMKDDGSKKKSFSKIDRENSKNKKQK